MIEWLATSCFSFVEGASFPDELLNHAFSLGYSGLGLADRMGQFGLVQGLRAYETLISEESAPFSDPTIAEIVGAPPRFFYGAGIRLHFDAADPLFVYPLHKAAHARLCVFLSNWALTGVESPDTMVIANAKSAKNAREKGISPLPWRAFRDFLRAESELKKSFLLVSASGRFYPWPENMPEREASRLQTQDIQKTTPTFCNPPTAPGLCPFWLLELVEICGQGRDSALSLAYPLTLSPGSEDLCHWLRDQSKRLSIPLLATSLPLYATKSERALCDLVTCVRHNLRLDQLGYLKQANSERRLLTAREREIFRKQLVSHGLGARPGFDPFERGFEMASRHHFSLRELKYRYPRESVPAGHTPSSWLRKITVEGACKRFPQGVPPSVLKQLEHELELIGKLEYEDYFLTIWEVLKYAREQKILFQGRGSAANSAVCYCLEITAVDPSKMDLLFERFLSLERREPPDIDVDFEHERREEVLQEVYRRYGRRHAAMVASVICFRHRMAVREAAKALGFAEEHIDTIIGFMGREGMRRLDATAANANANANEDDSPTARELKRFLAGAEISPRRWKMLIELAPQLVGLPRHLGLHTGGFVLSSERLDEQCVLEPARMENRSVVPWDKDDVDYLRWMKVDLLSLGMLTAIRKCFDHISEMGGPRYALATIPSECPVVYKTLARADTVGIFQIESRAQMNMLPRLVPKCFYDLVVEVAIVRPGPLQGGMVHPYLRRRQGKEPVVYDHPSLEPILKKTLGVPIFQEQVMKVAIAVAGFTPGEADQLRKVMSGAWRSKSSMHLLRQKLMTGMAASGLSGEFAERIYKQIEGFGEYGFPESHAASFAILTYVSSWMKVHHPSEFLCALLNSQPMGFYSTRALIGDAERHGVRVMPVDALLSRWDSYVEPDPFEPDRVAVRLGLRLIKGLQESEGRQIESLQISGVLSPEHEEAPSFETLRRCGLQQRTLETLAAANAFRTLAVRDPVRGANSSAAKGHARDPRRAQQWQLLKLRTEGGQTAQPRLDLREAADEKAFLEAYDEWQSLLRDYRTTGTRTLSEGGDYHHPVQYARAHFFTRERWTTADGMYHTASRAHVKVLGLLGTKQRPPTAGGLCFLTLEDETGFLNLTLMPDIYEQYRLVIDFGVLIAATGTVENSERVDPNDPRTAAYSLRVTRLWNPFAATNGDAPANSTANLTGGQIELGSRVRAYH